jgi:hypothetical protein
MDKTYQTEIYHNIFRTPVLLLAGMLGGVASFIYLGRSFHNILLGAWVPCLMLFIPFLFSKKIKDSFMKRNAILGFDDNEFSITQLSLDSDEEISQDSFAWHEIRAYRFYFDKKKNTSLTLYLENKNSKTFVFNDHKTFEEAVKTYSFFSTFSSFVNSLPQDPKILPRAGFLATKTGKSIIIFEICLIIVGAIIHSIRPNFGNSYYVILGVGTALMFPQIKNRWINKVTYEKICKLGNLNDPML